MRISDWSSDVRSSDLHVERQQPGEFLGVDGRNRGQAAQRRRVQHQYVQRLPAVRNGMGQPPDAFAVDQVQRRGGRMAASLMNAILDRKSTRLNSSHSCASRMPSSACKKQPTFIQSYNL